MKTALITKSRYPVGLHVSILVDSGPYSASILCLCEQWRLRQACTKVQACLSLCWSLVGYASNSYEKDQKTLRDVSMPAMHFGILFNTHALTDHYMHSICMIMFILLGTGTACSVCRLFWPSNARTSAALLTVTFTVPLVASLAALTTIKHLNGTNSYILFKIHW